MDAHFQPAIEAMHRADVEAFSGLVREDRSLATGRSSESHPTLLQCLVLEGKDLPAETQIAMAQALVDAGAPIDEPFVATGSAGNVVLAEYLLERGAALDGKPDVLRGWTVLEEALYWGFPELVGVLLQRGARVRNLRIAAGVGDVARLRAFFDAHGGLRPEAGRINWPFGELPVDQQSDAPQAVLDNALGYAAMGDHERATEELLDAGAAINAYPLGFHYRGTALHWAAVRGLRAMCDLLLDQGADPSLHDLTVQKTAEGWAAYANHHELAAHLASRAA